MEVGLIRSISGAAMGAFVDEVSLEPLRTSELPFFGKLECILPCKEDPLGAHMCCKWVRLGRTSPKLGPSNTSREVYP